MVTPCNNCKNCINKTQLVAMLENPYCHSEIRGCRFNHKQELCGFNIVFNGDCPDFFEL